MHKLPLIPIPAAVDPLTDFMALSYHCWFISQWDGHVVYLLYCLYCLQRNKNKGKYRGGFCFESIRLSRVNEWGLWVVNSCLVPSLLIAPRYHIWVTCTLHRRTIVRVRSEARTLRPNTTAKGFEIRATGGGEAEVSIHVLRVNTLQMKLS